MKDEHNWSYTATGEVEGIRAYAVPLKIEAWTYDDLVEKIRSKVAELSYMEDGANSYRIDDGPFFESYARVLVWPNIKWTIKREER